MRNHLLLGSRCLLGLLVLAFVLSFTIGTGYGKEFRNLKMAKAKIGKKAFRFNKDHPRLRAAIEAHRRHAKNLMDTFGVVGTGIGIAPDGEPVVRVFTENAGLGGIPQILDGVPVRVKATGRFYALADPDDRFPRPVPIGVSTGHPDITAGTIGCRVTDGEGEKVFALSNNHIYAAVNNASIGDNVLQPGDFDGGVDPGDAIGTLFDFEPIRFCNITCYWWFCWVTDCPETNTIDAAIAWSSPENLGCATLPDDPENYGSPNPEIHPAFGDPDIIGDDDENLNLLLDEDVQKCGRTTGCESGTVNTIGATVDVCYDLECLQVGRYVDQIIIGPGTFSSGGDSGSLIVSVGDNRPVGLLFAGSETQTIANRIDLVLNRFGVTVDDCGPTLPTLSIDDVEVYEEDSGTPSANFTVTLSDTSEVPVTVYYATTQGTATAHDDYVSTSGTLTFSPEGLPEQTISVEIRVDTAPESDETFYVDLSNPVGATISKDRGVGTILNDDGAVPPPPELSIGDVTVTEGDLATPNAVFTVTLSRSSDGEVSVRYVTENGTAEAGSDYESKVDTLIFPIGETTRTIDVAVLDDDEDELDEYFTVQLSNPSGATISDGQAIGTILDDDEPEPSSGPKLWTGTVMARTDEWTSSPPLGQSYDDMVVVCTPNYDKYGTPVVAQVKNASDDSFDVKIAPAVFGLFEFEPAWSAQVHCMAVEAGVYTVEEHDVKMEAVKYTSTVTDWNRSWSGQLQTYANDYQNPVVLGQVMTYNCGDRCHCNADITNPGCYWTVFWSRSASSAKNPPNNTTTDQFRVGKHVGEDSMSPVYDETIGYIVIETGEGTIDGKRYYARLGPDFIRGVGNSPPYIYAISGLTLDPKTAILSQAAMDGGNGGWAILYGADPVRVNGLNIELRIGIEEDWWWDSERRHTTEQVAFILFE